MRKDVVSYLACPNCAADVSLAPEAAVEADGHVMKGELVCAKAACRFPIEGGVPRLLPKRVEEVKTETALRFADEWTHWSDLRDYYERQFLGWVGPVGRADFAGKTVFEGGCGKGRHTDLVARFGAKAVVSIDLGESAHVAFGNTRQLPNAHVVVGDLLTPPVKPVFDLAFSVGVVHHLPDPAAGFRSLASKVRDGGRVVVWVYGRENNEWITRFVDPLRHTLTARLSPGLLRQASALPSAAMWGAIKLLYKPGGGSKIPGLPYAQYFGAMHDFPYDEIHSIVFDQLVTPVAHYLPGDEVRAWFKEGFKDVVVRWHNEMSWTGTGIVSRNAKG